MLNWLFSKTRKADALAAVPHRARAGATFAAKLSFEAVEKRYDERAAVHAFSLDIAPGEVVCLLGPSGCGKTTLLRLAAGIERPTGGRILINDREIEHILEAAQAHGARAAGYVLLRLPHELKQHFRDWLDGHVPERAEHVMSLVRQSRGGRDYDASFSQRQRGTGAWAQLVAARFNLAWRRLGYSEWRSKPLDTTRFVPPRPPSPQAELF